MKIQVDDIVRNVFYSYLTCFYSINYFTYVDDNMNMIIQRVISFYKIKSNYP